MKSLKEHVHNILLTNDQYLRNHALPKRVLHPTLVKYSSGLHESYGGLYDPMIFGYSEHCRCPKSRQTIATTTNVRCPGCNKIVYTADNYAKNFALYDLSAPYVSFFKAPALYEQLNKIFGYSVKFKEKSSQLEQLWSLYFCIDTKPFEPIRYFGPRGEEQSSEPIVMVDSKGVKYWVAMVELPGENSDDIPKVDQIGQPIDINNMGLFGIKKISTYRFLDGTINNIMGDLVSQELIITSPATRMLGRVPKSENSMGFPQLSVPKETANYLGIMNYNKQVEKYLIMKQLSITDKATYCWFLNLMINAHFRSSEFLASSKQSTTRKALDTRIKASIRALIVPSLDLPMDTLGVPITYLYDMAQVEIVDAIENYLTENSDNPNEILDATEIYKKKTPLAMEIFRNLFETRIDEETGEEIVPAMCTLVRNPTLHVHNFLSFKIKLVDDTAFHLPIAVDEGYNADHDGDTVAIWVYTSPEAVYEMRKITADNIWFYNKEFRSPYTPKDEILYGLYMATVVKTSGKTMQEFKSLKEAEEAFNNGKLPVNVQCRIGHKKTTFGRAYLSENLNIDIDTFIKCYPQTGSSSDHSPESYKDEFTLPKKPKVVRVQGEPDANYEKRLKKAQDDYNKEVKKIEELKAYEKKYKYISMDAIGKKNINILMQILSTHNTRLKEYALMQQFGAKIATLVGLGPGLYTSIFDLTQKDINAVLDKKNNYLDLSPELQDAKAMELKAELRKKFEENVTENLNKLDGCNIRELQNSFGKLNIGKLMVNYCPTINGDTLDTLNAIVGDSLFEGMSEESYYRNGEQNRYIWKMKQGIVPVSGYLTRQFADTALNVIYDADAVSKDTYGVLLKEEDAKGREVIERMTILEPKDPGDGTGIMMVPKKYVRVKSYATKLKSLTPKAKESILSRTVCGDEIANGFDIKLGDKKIKVNKYNPNKNSSIGIAYAISITEHITQAGLGLKHGGDLKKLSEMKVTAPGMLTFVKQEDKYLYFTAMEPCLNFKVGDTLKYLITSKCLINEDLKPGSIINKGDTIMKSSTAVLPDDVLARMLTLTGGKSGDRDLGKALPMRESWTISEGKISYKGDKVTVGDVEYEYEDFEVYLYPEGTKIGYAQQICTGIPDMTKLTEKWKKVNPGAKESKDFGILYAVYYYYIKSLNGFEDFNSEPLELMFGLICDYGYNLQKAIENMPDIMNRFYYGGAVKVLQNAVKEVVFGNEEKGIQALQPKYDKRIPHLLNSKVHDDVELQELTLKNKSTTSPTIRRISIANNFEGDYDWKTIIQTMYNEGAKSRKTKVSWNWDKVRENLREFEGTVDGYPKYTYSIDYCKTASLTSPTIRKALKDLNEQLAELEDAQQVTDKPDELKELNSKIEAIKEAIKKYETTENENFVGAEFWKNKLKIAKEKYGKIPNKTLATKLTVWLSKIRFGASLNAYVDVKPTKGITLIITLDNQMTDMDENELEILNRKIQDLEIQLVGLDKDKDQKKIEKISNEIKKLTKERNDLENNTIASIPAGFDGPLSIILRER